MNYLHHLKRTRPLVLKRLYRSQAKNHGFITKVERNYDIQSKGREIFNRFAQKNFF